MRDVGLESDPPEKIEIASRQFSAFLASESWPAKICWLTREDILIGCRDFRFLVRPQHEKGLKEAERTYRLGLQRGLGIALIALCASDRETFTCVEIPEDDLDRQCRLMGKKLKLSHPAEKRKSTVVHSDLRWKTLSARYAERSKLIWL